LASPIVLAVLLTAGCNMASLGYLLSGPDPAVPPEWSLAPAGKDKSVKMVLLASIPSETRPEFLRMDRELCDLLSRRLREHFREKKEYVTLVPLGKVEKFKDDHMNWRTWDLQEIAKFFKADYVAEVEVQSVSLYEPGSGNQLFRGRTDLTVTLFNAHKEDDGILHKDFALEYPKSRGPVPVSDMSYQHFRHDFLDYVAKHVSWLFISHPTGDDISCE
jgi:hypothetical protein